VSAAHVELLTHNLMGHDLIAKSNQIIA